MEVQADISLTKALFGGTKQLDDERLSFDKKDIYVGDSNWRIRWKDVQDLKVDTRKHSVWLQSSADNVRELQFTLRDPRQWQKVCDFVEKCWSKQQLKRDEVNPTATSFSNNANLIKSFGRQRRTFGSNQRRTPTVVNTFRSRLMNSKGNLMKRQIDYSDDPSDHEDNNDEIQSDDNVSVDQQSQTKDGEHKDDLHEHDEVVEPLETQTTNFDTTKSLRRSRLQKLTQKRRLKTKREDDSSDDDDLFSPAPITTPASQRVVSPTEALTDKVEAEDLDDQPTKSTWGNSTLTNYFAPRPKSTTSSSESTADRVLKTKSRFVSNKDNSSPLQSSSFVKVLRTKSLSPLKKDTEWLSQASSTSPPNKASTPSDTATTPLRRSPKTDSFHSSLLKRRYATLESYKEDFLTTPTFRKRMRLHPRIGGYGRYSSEVDNESTKATWLSHGSDSIELANDPSETRLTIAGTSPKSCWKGLRNMGNTCYLNASLQMLFSVGSFVSSLSAWSGNLTRSIVTLANTLAVPSTPYSRSPDAKPVKAAIDKVTDKFEGYLQRDAHEFLSDLIDQVHVELEAEVKQRADGRGGKDEATETPEGDQVKEEEGYDSMDVKSSSTVKFESQELMPSNVDDATPLPTDEFFRLNIQVRLECTCCGYTRSKEELYRHLSLDVAGTSAEDEDATIAGSIQTSLERFFQPEELEIKCEKCETGDRATQTLRIMSQPKALLLHLKRFVVVEERQAETEVTSEVADSAGMLNDETKPPPPFTLTFQKNRSRVEIPERLTLESFCLEQASENAKCYDLKSVVHHIGNTASSGHYTAHALRSCPAEESSPNKWVSFDDAVTNETTMDAVVSSIRSQRSAYMLLYVCDD